MIRLKAKSWLLSIMIIMACFCFFGCKDGEVGVDSAAFTEPSITMLVGDTYSPSVKILPSYATDRTYTLISDDVTALKVEGGSITALKAARGVKLKVVSNNNSNANDIVVVDIYDKAIRLNSPEGLSFNGESFSFVSNDNLGVQSYELQIGGKIINIGNNINYDFSNLIGKINEEDLYNKEISCSVRAVGDGRVFTTSEFGEEIKFVKLSKVSNAYVQNEILFFEGITNVTSYTVSVFSRGELVESKTVNGTEIVSLDVSNLTDSVAGASYELAIRPNIEGYLNSSVDVYGGESVSIRYNVLGKVDDLTINNRVISWGFVDNATDYTGKLHKGGIEIASYSNVGVNYIEVNNTEPGNYSFKVIANSSQPNTTTGKQYSQELSFTILPAPTVQADSNTIRWSSVPNSSGYLVTVKSSNGVPLIYKKFVLDTMCDVSELYAGNYSVEVISHGNGTDVIASGSSVAEMWTVLKPLQVNVENRAIYWADVDEASQHKYYVQIKQKGGAETVLVDKLFVDYGTEFGYDSTKDKYFLKLANYSFEPSEYSVSVQSVGEGNVFDARPATASITKLSDASIVTMLNKTFTIEKVASGVSYEMKVYNSNNEEVKDIVTAGVNTFSIDDSGLVAGNYRAQVYVYGNGKNILDADNSAAASIKQFSKLGTPELNIDGSTNPRIYWSSVAGAEEYKLYENATVKSTDECEYPLSALGVGNYSYRVQAIGNKADVLDGAVTMDEAVKNVKKLSEPTISFNKDNKKFTMECVNAADDEYAQYKFELSYNTTVKSIQVVNGGADCAAEFDSATEYTASAYAESKTIANAEYDLIMSSATTTYRVSKLAAPTDFAVLNGKLIVTGGCLTESGYNVSVRVDFGVVGSADDDIHLTEFRFDSGYELDLYSADYLTSNSVVNQLLENPGNYKLYVTVSKNDDNVIDSNEVGMDSSLKVLSRVSSISKNGQTIEFDAVAGASSYVAIITVKGAERLIPLTNEHYIIKNGENKNSITIEALMEQFGAQPLANTLYSISFVSVPNNLATDYMANRGTAKYQFEFLATPNVSVVEQASKGNAKFVKITYSNASDANKVGGYDVVINQSEPSKEVTGYWTKENINTYIALDNLTQFAAGDISIDVMAKAQTGNYFNSKSTSISITKLASEAITIQDGKLSWTTVENAKQYNLIYTKGGDTDIIPLSSGAPNFTIAGNTCVYDFVDLGGGDVRVKLQVDSAVGSGERYYINSDEGAAFMAYKLYPATIKAVGGNIAIEIPKSDYDSKLKEIELFVNNTKVDIDITEKQQYIDISEIGDNTITTIDPILLLEYGVEDLREELIKIKLYSSDDTTLNSAEQIKSIKGLLKPAGLGIVTSTTEIKEGVIDEVIEQIQWNNPTQNLSHVSSYEVVMTYNKYEGKEFVFNVENSTVLTMPTDYDLNENGEIDSDEQDIFGAGVYTIKVRSLTSDSIDVVNSNYCDNISITVLETPSGLKTLDGNIYWNEDANAKFYSVRIYKLDNVTEAKLTLSTNTNATSIDLCTLQALDTGVYGVTIQARNNENGRILASKESEMLQVIRLPQVQDYYLDDGDLYINIHKFFTRAEIYLTTTRAENNITHKLEIINSDLSDYNSFVADMVKDGKDWADTDILSTYTSTDYIKPVKCVGAGTDSDGTLIGDVVKILSENHTMTVKLYGNTADGVGTIISGFTSAPKNKCLDNENSVVKLAAPNLMVSSRATERGVVILQKPDNINYPEIGYYRSGDKALRGVYLYRINIRHATLSEMYIAQIFNETELKASLTAVGSDLITDDDQIGLTHFTYDGKTFNVIDKTVGPSIELKFNFNGDNYYYYTISGIRTYFTVENGGNFVVSCRLLGDDTRHAKSNLTPEVVIKRYSSLEINTSNGQILWDNLADEVDEPIYVITITQGSGAAMKEYNLALYREGKYTKEDVKALNEIAAEIKNGKKYLFDTINYFPTGGNREQVITYSRLADKICEFTKDAGAAATGVAAGGRYSLSIRAYCMDSAANDKIKAQTAIAKPFEILAKTQISVVNGKLLWELSKYSNGATIESIKNYKIEVLSDGSTVSALTLTDGEYKVDDISGKAVYDVENLNGILSAEQKYTFKLTTLAGDNNGYINSASSDILAQILPEATNVKMVDGKLTWGKAGYSGKSEIYIGYELYDGTNVQYTPETDGSVYDLPESAVDDSGTERYFVSGNIYSIKVRLLGNSEADADGIYSISGFYVKLSGANEDKTQRLSTVTHSNVTSDGVLHWNEVFTPDGEMTVQYKVQYVVSGVPHSTGLLDSNKYDFDGVSAGTISDVCVVAYHNDYFTSKPSSTLSLTKYESLDAAKIAYNMDGHTITWEKAKLGEDEINNYRVKVIIDGAEYDTYDVLYDESNPDKPTNVWEIDPSIGDNVFSVAIQCIAVGNTEMINSDYTSPVEISLPQQVGAESFIFNTYKQRFEWQAPEGWQDSDKHYISYVHSVQGYSGEFEATEFEVIDGTKYYYYYPYCIGQHSQIHIQIERAKQRSQPTYCYQRDESGNITANLYTLNFDLFNSGDGSNKNPYAITSEYHLRNIKYFLGASYRLDEDIVLEKPDSITGNNEVFTGSIDGQDKCIYQYSTADYINAKNTNNALGCYTGLFARVDGATFKNIMLANMVCSGYISDIRGADSGMMHIGLFVGKANNTTFNSITVSSSYINVRKYIDKTEHGNAYVDTAITINIGAIAAYANASEFNYCKVHLDGQEQQNVKINIEGNGDTIVNVGGMAGYAINCEFSNNKADVIEDVETGEENLADAFVLGYILSEKSGALFAPQLYIGALAGRASGTTYEDNEYVCSYILLNIDNELKTTTNLSDLKLS